MGAVRWELFCEGQFVYSTTDEDDAESWVQADPLGHEARRLSQVQDEGGAGVHG